MRPVTNTNPAGMENVYCSQVCCSCHAAQSHLLPAEGARWLLRVRARLPFPARTPAARTAMYLRAASSVAFYVFLPPPYALRRLAWQRTGRGSRCRGPCRTRRCSRYSTCYTLTASSITHPTVIRCMRNVLYCSGTTCAQADSVKLWQGYAAPAPQQQARAMVPGPYSQAPQMTASPLMTQMTSPPHMTQMFAAPQMTQLTAPQRTQLTAPQMTQMSAVPQMQYMMPATAAVAPAPAPPPVQVIAFPLLHFQLCGWIVCTPFRSE